MVCDAIMGELEERYAPTYEIVGLFKSVLGKQSLKATTDEINEKISNLCKIYSSDIDEIELKNEISAFKYVLQEICKNLPNYSICSIFKEFTNLNLNVAYPNIDILFRLFLILPPTSVSCERSFSKLKLIKTYLRSTMGEERLSNLAILSIEKNLIHYNEFDAIIDQFANVKSRKIRL
jgi:hypothetical protein